MRRFTALTHPASSVIPSTSLGISVTSISRQVKREKDNCYPNFPKHFAESMRFSVSNCGLETPGKGVEILETFLANGADAARCLFP